MHEAAHESLALARRYLALFESGVELERLLDLLHPALRFEGPLASFHSARDYVAALQADPPRGCRVHPLHESGDAHRACLFYELESGGARFPVAQLFDVEDGRITRIRLVFDASRLRAG